MQIPWACGIAIILQSLLFAVYLSMRVAKTFWTLGWCLSGLGSFDVDAGLGVVYP